MQFNRVLVSRCRQLQILRLNFVPTRNSQSTHNLTRKFLINNGQAKNRKKWHTNKFTNPSLLAQPRMNVEKDSNRCHALNKVFMDQICDLLSTGNLSSVFTAYDLEISEVKVSPDLTNLNVYWFCTGSDEDTELQKIFNENAHALRHELSQQRVLGRVPQITFVKDKRMFKMLEIERLLAVADFGPGYEPSDPLKREEPYVFQKAEVPDHMKIAQDVFEDGEHPDFFHRALAIAFSQFNKLEESAVDLPPDLPIMKDDVFGVKTFKIYSMVQRGITRGKAEHRKSQGALSPTSAPIYPDQDSNLHNLLSRTKEIRIWTANYESIRRKKRRERKYDTLSNLPLTNVGDAEEISYEEEEEEEEEEDSFDESFEDNYD